MTAKTDFSESCRANPRLIESVSDLVMFAVKAFINLMVYKIIRLTFCKINLGMRFLKNGV